MTRRMKSFILRQMQNNRTMTIATVRKDGWPQATTVAYVNDGLNLFFCCDPDSQKVRNISRCKKVSVTIDRGDEDWDKLQGLSMGATAMPVTDPMEIDRALRLLGRKFPALAGAGKPDPSETAVVKVVPKVISAIDYTRGFGHTDLVRP